TIKLWNLDRGKVQRNLKGHTGKVSSVVFSPDGKTLASGSHDNTIKLWNVETGQVLRTLQGHSDWVNCVAFTPDGKTLASASDDETIRLWDIETGKAQRAHAGGGCCVAFSPDGSLLASGSSDGRVRLWRTDDGSLLHNLEGHSDDVRSVTFAPKDLEQAAEVLSSCINCGADDGDIRQGRHRLQVEVRPPSAHRRVAEVVLVAGVTRLPTPFGVRRIDVGTALEMRDAVLAEFEDASIVIKAAAVADFRPARTEKHKIKRRRGELKLELESTADLLEEVAREKGSRLLVGFAAESENVVENARLKLETKHLDLVVANDITREGAGFDGETNIVTLLSRDGRQTDLPKMNKQAVADLILDEVVRLRSRVESGRAQSLPR
ncbi:MAG: hypothetical protein IH793_09435, partial [Acidobacteria bacterium]|nr:hypothetical protein [Acidobacteriota bacterium]